MPRFTLLGPPYRVILNSLVFSWATIVSGGCGGVCKGPGCSDEWPAARIAVHRADRLGRRTAAWSAAHALYDGDRTAGAPWVVRSFGRGLVFGQPGRGTVIRVDYREGSGPVLPVQQWEVEGSGFGTSLAVGLADEDGRVDLWVGAPQWNLEHGAVYLFRDAGASNGAVPDLQVRGSSPADRLGERLTLCGDLTGDGLPELVAHAPWFTTPGDPTWPHDLAGPVPELSGAVFLFRSQRVLEAEAHAAPWDLGPIWWGAEVGDGAGQAAACDADLTGDGVPDLAVGAPWANTGAGGSQAGRVYVLSGAALPPSGPIDGQPYRVLDGRIAAGWFGTSIVGLEVDGQAPSDLAIGAPGSHGGRGAVHLVPGAQIARVQDPLPLTVFEHSSSNADHYGRWLASGDLDGDGRDDLVVGAPDRRDGRNGFDTGRVWVYRGASRETWRREEDGSVADDRILGHHPFQRVGRDPWIADLDGDGLGEVLLPTRWAPQE